jgi:hypothetical protein
METKITLHKWKSLKLALSILLLFTSALVTRAQPVNTYTFSSATGTYTPITGGTVLGIATNDDTNFPNLPIGFTFNYNGTAYTNASVNSNGFLALGGAVVNSYTSLSSGTSNNVIAALNFDLQGNVTTGNLSYLTSGVTPNRVFTVQWTSYRYYGATGDNFNFQINLFESTNVIQIAYGAFTKNATSRTAQVGLRGSSNAVFNNRTSATSWTASASGTLNSSNMTLSTTVLPPSGLTFTFTPPPPCSGTPTPGIASLTNLPGCGTGNYVLAVSGASLNPGLSYQWESSPDTITWTAMTNDTLVGLTKPQVTALTYFRRVTTCTNSSLSAISKFVAVKPVYAGNANATAPVCGDSLTLSLTNASASISSFQWEESTDNITFTPIPSATLASQKVPTPLANTWYRAVVNCTASSSTDNSVSVLVRPARGGTTNLVSSNCLDSTTLNLTGASTGPVTYAWLSSTDSITWVPMGITTASAIFASPTATRFYRCVVTCGTATDTSFAVRVNEPCQGFGPYSITRTTGVTYTSIQTTGNQFTWSNAFSGDDDNTSKVSMPFPFVYQGAVQTAFYVSTNGWLSFDTATVTNNLTNNLNSTNPRRVIAPLWEDLVSLGNTNANKVGLIRHATTGTAPNRVLTVEWAEMERFGYGSPSLNFQVKLYEGTNNIELVYGRMQPFDGNGTGSFDYSLGLTGNNPVAGQKLALLLENKANFSTTTVNNTLSIVPLCNTSYLFTSGATFNPTNASAIPSNDSSSAPILLSVNPIPCTDGCGTYYSTRGATSSGTAIAPLSGTADDDVWFSFVAPVSGQVNISVLGSSAFDPAFMVMNNLFDTTGLGAAASRNAATNAIESVQATGLTPNATYLIRLFHAGVGAGSTSGAFSICVNEIIPPPANDDTSGAVVLNVGTACTSVTGTTIGSTASAQAVCGGLADDDVWYRFIPSAAVDTVTVAGTGTFRPHVQVLTRTLTSIDCVNNNVNAGTVKITLTNLLKDSTYYIRVYHTNAGTATGGFSICVNGAQATAPVVTTGGSSNVITISATLTGNIVNGGGFPVTVSGIVYSTSPAPVLGAIGVIDSANVPVITAGLFNRNIGGLLLATTYYYRAYATNILGTSYGADSTFTTPGAAVVPTVLKVAATNVTATTAIVGGNITSDGGAAVTASGIVYATTPNPALFGTGVVDSTTNPLVLTGSFNIYPSGFIHSTKYYYRAYATNSVGTAYSIQDSFITSPIVASFPYNQNFDGLGNTGWSSTAIGTGTNAWQLGTPAKTFLNGAYSGANAWVTSLVGNYLGTEDCAVVSPQFDFTAYTNAPVLRFRHKMDVDADVSYDGGVVEISINNGAWTRVNNALGAGTNFNTANSHAWYNDAQGFGSLGANIFSDITSLYASQASGWIESAVPLTGAAGQSNVKIRFRFVADFFTDEGWAIDNIEVVNIVAPTTAASNVTVTPSVTSANVTCTAGNGQGRMIIARLSSALAVAPTNNTLYAASAVFGSANITGTGNFIVYMGSGTSVNVSGLTALTGYTFDVYEYNGKYMHNSFAGAISSSTTTTPVKLVSLIANNVNEDVLVKWTTASEVNNRGFNVERSVDGKTFEFVGFVKGSGNSSVTKNYALQDANAFATTGVNKLYYRLKQLDNNGKFEYSQVVTVQNDNDLTAEIVTYPNPFSDKLSIGIKGAKAGNASIQVMDISGRLIMSFDKTILDGNQTLTLDGLAPLSQGVYFVRVSASGLNHVTKLIKQ